jgi:hypothetical protein
MERVRVGMRSREQTMLERRDRVAPIRDLDPRDHDVCLSEGGATPDGGAA